MSTTQSSKNWCFTWNNYTDETINELTNLSPEFVSYIVFGKEICPTTKTPHLQGYIELKEKIRMTAVKKIMDKNKGIKSPINLSIRKAKVRSQAINYCLKGEQPKEEWESLGIKGPNFGKNAEIFENKTQIKKENKFEKIINNIESGAKMKDLLKTNPEECIKFPNGINNAINEIGTCIIMDNLKEKLSKLILRDWQIQLKKDIAKEPDDRKIIWIVDKIGNAGKTTFAKLLLSEGNTAYFSNAKTADIAYAYKGEKTVIFDFARSNENAINYQIIEQVKNGLIFSAKYQSTLKVSTCPHVIIMSNFEPDKTKLSLDRWDIRYIENNINRESGNTSSIEDALSNLKEEKEEFYYQ